MVDVLILNYNDALTTLDYINRIKNYQNIRKILVVDNFSTDESFSLLSDSTSNFNNVEIISSKINGGYGKGNNYGIRYLINNYNSKYILLSNPDVIVEENTINNLEKFLEEKKDYAIVAPFMLDKDGIRQINTAFRIQKVWDYIFSFELIWSKYFSSQFYKNIYKENGGYLDVDGVSGSLFMMNANNMFNHGMFDENIFLYCEEITLAIKLKKASLKTALLLKDSFIHNHSVSISKSYDTEVKKHRLLIKSKLYVIKQYYKVSTLVYMIAKVFSKISLLEIFLWSLFKNNK